MKGCAILFCFLCSVTLLKSQDSELPPPPPPPPPPQCHEEVNNALENMPRFPGCEDMELDYKKQDECVKQKMLEYIYENLEYPQMAKINKIEGMVVLQFLVNVEGKLDDIRIVRDIGHGCGEAAVAVFTKMNEEFEWRPGIPKRRKIKILYTMPVRFKL